MKRLLLHLIRGYRTWISPAHAPCCRYAPTCSTYALEALEKHGAWKGGVLSLWRVLRCNPFSRGGYDPVPAVWPAPRAISLCAKTEEREKPSWKAIS